MSWEYKKNNIAQVTAEYAILASLIIAALVMMQLYLKRGVQARLRDAIDYPVSVGVFNTSQYDPGYINSTRIDVSDETTREQTDLGGGITRETTAISASNLTSVMGNYYND